VRRRAADEHFDRWQFDDVRISTSKRTLYGLFGHEDINRMQVFTGRRNPHSKPEWLKSRKSICGHLKYRLHTVPLRQRRSRFIWWLEILYRYYRLNWASRDIAEHFGVTLKSVKRTLEHLNSPIK
jgi:hypothetical protein